MFHNFWLAKPYGLANQKLCYIQIYKTWEEHKECFWSIFINLSKNVPCLVLQIFLYLDAFESNNVSLINTYG